MNDTISESDLEIIQDDAILIRDDPKILNNYVANVKPDLEPDLEFNQEMSSINKILNSEKNSTGDDDVHSDGSEPFQDSGSEYVPSNHSEQRVSEESEENPREVVQANLSNDELETPRARKRVRSKRKFVNCSNSERNKNKLKRMKGETYVSLKLLKEEKTYKKIQKAERNLGPACRCKQSTTSNQFFCQAFTELERKAIFDQFWQNLTWSEKKVYISGLVDTALPKCHRTGNEIDPFYFSLY